MHKLWWRSVVRTLSECLWLCVAAVWTRPTDSHCECSENTEWGECLWLCVAAVWTRPTDTHCASRLFTSSSRILVLQRSFSRFPGKPSSTAHLPLTCGLHHPIISCLGTLDKVWIFEVGKVFDFSLLKFDLCFPHFTYTLFACLYQPPTHRVCMVTHPACTPTQRVCMVTHPACTPTQRAHPSSMHLLDTVSQCWVKHCFTY